MKQNFLSMIWLIGFCLFYTIALPSIGQAEDAETIAAEEAAGSVGNASDAQANENATQGSGGCSWEEFRKALGQQESGNNYGSRNKADYVGRYQFGEAALNTIGWYNDNLLACGQCKETGQGVGCEAGMVQMGNVQICKNDYSGSWSGEASGKYNINSITDFLANEQAQDRAFDLWFRSLYKSTKKCHNRVGQSACGCKVTMSGILAASHLGGAGGGCRAANGGSTGDGGSSTCAYLCKFADYEVPPDVTEGPTITSSGNCKGCDTNQATCEPKNDPDAEPQNGITGAGALSEDDFTSEEAKFDDLSEMLKKIWVKAFMMMTSQLTATMMDQVQGIGMLFDAKHQLETQRDMQELYAQAHKDYHPSEQMCEIGTMVRHLADTEKRADLTQVVISNRILEREIVAGDTLAAEAEQSDKNSRFKQFKETFCNQKDNGNALDYLCKDGNTDSKRKNRDIDFTTTLDMPLTLEIDFLDNSKPTEDEENVMALVNYLFQHDPFPNLPEAYTTLRRFTKPYQDMRSIIAMRGVARNSISNIIAQKTAGPDYEENAAPYIRALLKEFGWDETEIEKMFGENPSYYAQMEILTQKIFQHPNFYTNLYDKPVNVKRIRAAIRAIKTMQDRDINEAMMRREMLLSIILELRIREHQRDTVNQIGKALFKDAAENN